MCRLQQESKSNIIVRTACPYSWTNHPRYRSSHVLKGCPRRRKIAYSRPRIKLWGSRQSFSNQTLNNRGQVHGIQCTNIFFSRLLPVEQADRVWVSHAEWNKFDVRLGEVLLLEAINCAFTVFLLTFSAYPFSKVTIDVPGEGLGVEQDKDHVPILLSNAAPHTRQD